MQVIFATGNKNKMTEIREILGGSGIEVRSMKEAGIEADIVEDGAAFEENALIKARAVAKILKEKGMEAVVLADDSGLEIDALDGAPGIHSSRFMGEGTSYHVKNAKLIEMLGGVPDERRTARFVCVIAAVFPDGTEVTRHGVMEGRIGYEEKGDNGFGYDPIFYLPECGCTSAELPGEEKNRLSHRGKALRGMKLYFGERENGENTDSERYPRQACQSGEGA